jgi:DNA-directed RNA polymerase specialized sigma24 family protein
MGVIVEMETGGNSELMKKIAGGDKSAFSEYLESTSPVVLGLVSRIVADPRAAEEVVLDVYTEAWRTADTYDPERATPLQWIAAIARSRAVVRRFEASVSNVPLSNLAVEVPDHLRDLVLLRLEQEPDKAAPPVASAPVAEVPKPAQAPPKESKPPSPPVLKPRQPARTSRAGFLPWVCALLLLVAAAYSLYRWRQADDNNSQLQRMVEGAQGDSQQLRSMLELERGRTRELEQLSTAISAPGSRIIHLVGQEAAPTASAAIFWDVQNSQWTLTGHLSPPPAGRIYQLWFVAPTGRIKAATLKAAADGHVFAVVDIPASVDKITGAAVSLEPESGSEQPTMPFQAIGKLLP